MADIKDLLSRIARNERRAFDQFYAIYYGQVYRFTYYFLRNSNACREVIIDIFFSIWQSRKKLPEVKNIETYLYIIARNESKRYLDKLTDSFMHYYEEIPFQIEAKEFSPEEKVLYEEMEVLLSEIINKLPEKCRVIYLMIREEGLKPKEIAKILSIQESTVRVQLKIAVEKLMTELRKHFPDLNFPMFFLFIINFFE
jgi:RNA polymerase sigma-70 factor (ECF subfamily)